MSDKEERGGEAESLIEKMRQAQIAKSGGGGKSSKTTKEEEEAYNSYVDYKKSQKYGGGGGGGSSASEFKELSREEKERLSLTELRKYLAAKEKHDREEGDKPDKEEFLRRYRVKEGASKPYVPPPKPVKEPPAQKPRPARRGPLTLPEWTDLLKQRVSEYMAKGIYTLKAAKDKALEDDDIKEEINWVKTYKERAEAEEAKRKSKRK